MSVAKRAIRYLFTRSSNPVDVVGISLTILAASSGDFWKASGILLLGCIISVAGEMWLDK